MACPEAQRTRCGCGIALGMPPGQTRLQKQLNLKKSMGCEPVLTSIWLGHMDRESLAGGEGHLHSAWQAPGVGQGAVGEMDADEKKALQPIFRQLKGPEAKRTSCPQLCKTYWVPDLGLGQHSEDSPS